MVERSKANRPVSEGVSLSALTTRHACNGIDSGWGVYYQGTYPGRLRGLDELALKTVRGLGLRPASFLDVGAAFNPERRLLYTPLPAQTTIDSRVFFSSAGMRLRFCAIDIVPIDDKAHSLLSSVDVEALTLDYNRSALERKFSIIRLANVSVNQTSEEFGGTVRNLFTMMEDEGILIIYNEITRGIKDHESEEIDELGVYQKAKACDRDTLREILFNSVRTSQAAVFHSL